MRPPTDRLAAGWRGWDEMHGLHGTAFSTGWTAMMGRSYAAQIALAHRELRSGVSPQARAYACWILTHRRADLAQMHRWYGMWAGSDRHRQDWRDGWHGMDRWHGMDGWHGMGRDPNHHSGPNH